MTVKYKVSDFAKDLNLSAKKVLDELAAMGSTGKKNSSNLEENELNYLLEKFSKDNSVADLDEFLNSAKAPKEEPKAEKKADQKAEKKAEKKPEAPKADKKPQQPAQRPKEGKAPEEPAANAASTATRSTSSIRSARRRPFPSANWHARPAPRLLLPRTGCFCPPRGQSGHRGYPHCGYECGPL